MPILKQGSELKPTSYRPVSLTSIPCKILERTIADNIIKHLITNKVFAKEHHGFLKGKSCTANLEEFLDTLTSALLYAIPIDVLYTDFQKAFDRVSHIKLCNKVYASGIVGMPLKWIKSLLSNRKKQVGNGKMQGKLG
ncbi:uncharacterized protein LOC105844018 [Hydra vulgaris]|uniref:uncharacterized protein LOC105844018 n=1 Tax=Hydra vulgaris TaxID=6087 RepID=UPI0006415C93|nr:uncharacterized protein LOC105844018 [Hydra vulgaris]